MAEIRSQNVNSGVLMKFLEPFTTFRCKGVHFRNRLLRSRGLFSVQESGGDVRKPGLDMRNRLPVRNGARQDLLGRYSEAGEVTGFRSCEMVRMGGFRDARSKAEKGVLNVCFLLAPKKAFRTRNSGPRGLRMSVSGPRGFRTRG